MQRFVSFVTVVLMTATMLGVSKINAQQFPYVAYVTSSNTYVRSGPGQQHYPTAVLSQGFAVEVYRHDENGWCALRPPAGSFDWIAAHQVRDLGNGIVEVISEQALARVGSTLSPSRSAVQVMLPKDEQLESFGKDLMDDPGWLRIAPPAGEFRWIAVTDLARQPPLEESPPPTGKSGWTGLGAATSAPLEPGPFDHLKRASDSATVSTGAGLSGLQFGTPRKNVAPEAVAHAYENSDQVHVVPGSPVDSQLAQFQAQNGGLKPPALLDKQVVTGAFPLVASVATPLPQYGAHADVTGSTRVRLPGLTSALSTRAATVEDVELRLSQTIVGPPHEWQLEPLRADANRLLQTAMSPAVRAQLRELAGRIERFQQIHDRYQEVSVAGDDGAQSGVSDKTVGASSPTSTASGVRRRAGEDLAVNGPLYDAVGLLKPVVSKRQKAPQYALVDDKGEVVSFVTPTPDLNLQPYLGRRIGVHGTRGFMPEYRRAHVTAGRVTPIEERILR